MKSFNNEPLIENGFISMLPPLSSSLSPYSDLSYTHSRSSIINPSLGPCRWVDRFFLISLLSPTLCKVLGERSETFNPLPFFFSFLKMCTTLVKGKSDVRIRSLDDLIVTFSHKILKRHLKIYMLVQ